MNPKSACYLLSLFIVMVAQVSYSDEAPVIFTETVLEGYDSSDRLAKLGEYINKQLQSEIKELGINLKYVSPIREINGGGIVNFIRDYKATHVIRSKYSTVGEQPKIELVVRNVADNKKGADYERPVVFFTSRQKKPGPIIKKIALRITSAIRNEKVREGLRIACIEAEGGPVNGAFDSKRLKEMPLKLTEALSQTKLDQRFNIKKGNSIQTLNEYCKSLRESGNVWDLVDYEIEGKIHPEVSRFAVILIKYDDRRWHVFDHPYKDGKSLEKELAQKIEEQLESKINRGE